MSRSLETFFEKYDRKVSMLRANIALGSRIKYSVTKQHSKFLNVWKNLSDTLQKWKLLG